MSLVIIVYCPSLFRYSRRQRTVLSAAKDSAGILHPILD